MPNKIVHESGNLHVTGKAVYIDDINTPSNTLHGFIVTSPIAKGILKSFDLSDALETPGVHAILSYKDIPGQNQMGTIVHDEVILVEKDIEFIGQGLFIIAADNEHCALNAKAKIKMEIEELEPVISLEDSMKLGLKLHDTIVMESGNINTEFAKCDHIIEAQIENGGQEHWYLETQVSLAIPGEYDEIKIYSSTQHPSETQALIAEALHVGKHAVVVETRRLGGAFGGKETQANNVAIWASLLANKTQKPVKIRLFRDEDQKITGKRHPFLINYKIGFNNDGIIKAYFVDFNANAGYSSDLSMAILARARTHAENAYFIPNIRIESTAWKTNIPSNTAFRGFGGPQGIYAIEDAMERVALKLGKEPAEIKYKNFYKHDINNTTPYGEIVENNRIYTIWDKIIEDSDYYSRKKKINEFNKNNEFKKRGIALTPVKFGISFNTPFLNQAGSLVNIYTDGTVLVNHGGIEMGQGLHTKIGQIVADEFGISLNKVKVNATITSTVPNTSATAASSGTDMNGMAAKNAADKLIARFKEFLTKHWSANTYKCQPENIIFKDNKVIDLGNDLNNIEFTEAVNLLYLDRISLSAQGFYKTPNLYFNNETQKGRPFHYFVWGISISEVELDILTGRHKILRTDILHDTGHSFNENIDIGQIEGAFIQGVGWCTSEEMKWDKKGNLLNHSPDTYKIPGIRDIPEIFNVELLKNAPNPNTIKQSKAVGEPPFIHGLSVFFAIKHATAAVNDHKKYPNLNIPATHEKIILAIDELKNNK
ncbi:MAG: xanthine dehydrogenase molybdopterin binding subunit [Salinivirgaceae bacterium]|nr:xanthine dehydrogenase molybdopterin binding subunit [Salinivirgaceae bacterium]